MTQNRPAPAFQEYAASMMAKTEYRVLSLAERGLLMTVRLECWVNRSVPSNAEILARMLGYSHIEVAKALPAIMPFLAEQAGVLICPEHEDYRAYLQSVSDRKSAGGKRGAATTNSKHKTAQTLSDPGFSNASGMPRLSRDSLVKSSSVKTSKAQPLERDVSSDAWLNDYEAASNGR